MIIYLPFLMIILVALVVSYMGRYYFPRLDVRRISENVTEHGGEVIRIQPHQPRTIGNRSDRVYDVAFKTRSGKRITTMCMTSVSSGVVWINENPPEDGIDISDDPQPIESISCLQCGAKMSPQATNCPQCGWSYRDQQAGK